LLFDVLIEFNADIAFKDDSGIFEVSKTPPELIESVEDEVITIISLLFVTVVADKFELV